MTTLNYGILGCGMMGAEHIRNIQLLDNCRVYAIHEPDESMRSLAAVAAPGVRFHASLEELVTDPELDCLVIVSPNFLHVQQLRQIANLRSLPILVEKPLATDPSDEGFIKELQASYSSPIWVAMEYRYMPPLARFIDMCDEATGGVCMLTIREHRFPFLEKVKDWNRFNKYSGGTLVEKCCHFFDLMRLITKSEPTQVMASGAQMVNHLDENYSDGQPDIWDAAYALFDFANGAKSMLELSMFAEGSEFQEHISAVGPNGKIECFIPGPTRFWPEHLGAPPEPRLVISPRNPSGPTVIEVSVDAELLAAGDHHGSTFYQHQAFQRVVLGEQAPEVTVNDGWLAVRMGMAAQQSSEQGQVVKLT